MIIGFPIYSIINNYTDKLLTLLKITYGQDVLDLVGTVIRKWYPEEDQPAHSDCEAIFSYIDGKSTMTPINNFSSIFIEYAALLYLNDDYEGGEIFFPDYNLKIKPKKNELIFFPGTYYYMHGVRKLLSGNRFVMQNFLTTPKLRYIWDQFVINEDPITFVDRTVEYASNNKSVFNRSNIPKEYKKN